MQAYFDFLPVPSHQPLGTLPSNRVHLNDANMVLGVPIEPLAKQQRIHMTPPLGPCLVCPPPSLVDVEMKSKVPTPPLVVVDNNVAVAIAALFPIILDLKLNTFPKKNGHMQRRIPPLQTNKYVTPPPSKKSIENVKIY